MVGGSHAAQLAVRRLELDVFLVAEVALHSVHHAVPLDVLEFFDEPRVPHPVRLREQHVLVERNIVARHDGTPVENLLEDTKNLGERKPLCLGLLCCDPVHVAGLEGDGEPIGLDDVFHGSLALAAGPRHTHEARPQVHHLRRGVAGFREARRLGVQKENHLL